MDLAGFVDRFRVEPGSTVDLGKDFDPGYTGDIASKGDAAGLLEEGIRRLAEDQDKLYAQNTYALLVVLQAMDAAGKDGVIKHVMSGLNPQGTQVFSFKAPTSEELDHDYLWRNFKALPERGRIGIWNRSHYEEVLIVRVHPELLEGQRLPERAKRKGVWRRRFREINDFERYLVDNGIVVVKLFLNVSKQEQKQRFLERIERPDKNWKLALADVEERQHWDAYRRAYEDVLTRTSTPWAPWYVIPADRKWFTRLAVAGILVHTMDGLDLAYPEVGQEQRAEIDQARAMLEAEGD
jgi:PPK2 family polyphosphate:nucleotide phosphotransferase